MANGTASSKHWHVGNWTGLGWLETGIKLVAHLVAFIALAWSFRPWDLGIGYGTELSMPGGPYLIQVILLAILALGLTAAIADRYLEKETIAMIFVLINVVAHWAMVLSLLVVPHDSLLVATAWRPWDLLPWRLLPIFIGLMLLGDLIKIVFLVRTKFTVRGYNPRLLVYLTGSVAVLEAILLVLSLTNS
ncbi:MAG: hypothetical protein ABI690_29745 [Chloroflexota bacterium]